MARAILGRMEKGLGTKASWKHRLWRGTKMTAALLAALFIGLVIWRIPYVAEEDRSHAVAAQIRAARLVMSDVDGSRLPPAPDPQLVDATVEGVDANGNGIRDDVELAIFEKYPGVENIKIRAAELQYAKALQFYLGSVFTEETMRAAMSSNARASLCLASVFPAPDQDAPDTVWDDFFRKTDVLDEEVADLVKNTEKRKEAYQKSFDNMTSGGGAEAPYCDIE